MSGYDRDPRAPGERLAPELQEPDEAVELTLDALEDFAAVDEPGVEALLGTSDENLIPVGADVMLYGDGGAGKTTLSVDLALHLGAGVDWLGHPVEKPRRVLLIEVEGSRPLFRRKLRRRLAAWAGPTLDRRVIVNSEPWGKFSFADEEMQAQLARAIFEHSIDLVIVGPLTAIGMEGAGTIAETRLFAAQLALVRERSLRPVSFLVIHHESKGGKVSGAWEGVPDTMIHVTPLGHGKLNLRWQKARHASSAHLKTLALRWRDDNGGGFEVEDAPPSRPERVYDDLAAFVLANGGTSWRPVEQAVEGTGDYLRRRRDQMLADGVLINARTPSRMELWHRDDPSHPTLEASVSADRHGSDTVNVDTGDGGAGGERVGVSVRSTDTPFADTLTPLRPPANSADEEVPGE